MVQEVLIVSIFIIYLFYKWATINDDYFKRRGVKSMKPSLLLANSKSLFLSNQSAADMTKNVNEEFPGEL